MFKQIENLLVVLSIAAWASTASAFPITDTVTVSGQEWAQVDLFTNLTWNDINTVCPGGVCGNGTLNGFDMAGWTWANFDNVAALFNFYIGSNVLGPESGYNYDEPNSTWASAMFADGWRPTFIFGSSATWLMGLTSGEPFEIPYFIPFAALYDQAPGSSSNDSVVMSNQADASLLQSFNTGVWFCRECGTPQSTIPVPATLPLLGLGLAAIGFSGRKHRKQICQLQRCS